MSNCRKFVVAKEVVEDFGTRLSKLTDTKGCPVSVEQAVGLLMSVCQNPADSASSAFLVKFHHALQYSDEEVMSESVGNFYNSKIDSQNKLIFPTELTPVGSVEFEISDRILDNMLFPPLLIQPLIENAIVHGLEPRHEPGKIELIVAVDQDNLVIQVRDNGAGLQSNNKGHGIGVENIRQRLAMQYGDQGYLDIQSRDSGGVESRLVIPKETEGQKNAAQEQMS